MENKPMIYVGRDFVHKMFDWYLSLGYCNQTAYDSTKETVYFQSQTKHNNFIDSLNQALWNEGAFKELDALKEWLIEEAQDYLADNAMVGKFHPDAMKLEKLVYPENYTDVFFPEIHPDATKLPRKDYLL